MKQGMTWDEIVRCLRIAGVPKSIAEARANAELGVTTRPETQTPAAPWFPIQLIVPWSALVSDNRKYAPVLQGSRAAIILQAPYRDAKRKAEGIAKEAMGGAAPIGITLLLIGHVFVPDNRPGHDVCNFAKCLLDAMQKVVYKNDDQLHRVTWIRAGVDVDRPRAEIKIEPL